MSSVNVYVNLSNRNTNNLSQYLRYFKWKITSACMIQRFIFCLKGQNISELLIMISDLYLRTLKIKFKQNIHLCKYYIVKDCTLTPVTKTITEEKCTYSI